MAVDVDAPERELSARGELSEDDSSHGDDEFTEQRDTQKRRHRTVLRPALTVGALAVVTLGSLTGWLGWRAYQAHSMQEQREV